MKALIMGGTQFVGSAMAKYLISEGYEVDIFTRGNKAIKYDGIRKHMVGDRKSKEDLKSSLSGENYDYVFDISAYTQEDVKLLTSVIERKALKRYVLCSSGSVYIPSDEKVTEAYPCGKNSNWGEYGYNKYLAEEYLLELYKRDGFPVTIFRPVYIYGEGNNLYREVYLFDRITKGLPIPIPAGDKQTQFIYIDDLVKVFESVVHIDKTIGQVYNVTRPEEISWEQLVATAMEAVAVRVEVKKVDNIKSGINDREFFPFRNVQYLVDITKAKNHGLYTPQIDLLEGMKKAYKWYCESKPQIVDSRMSRVDEALEL